MDATVLVVEHDDVSREVTEVSLRSAGWRVVAVPGALEAIAHVEAQPPDVIITETRMSGMDGFALIRRLRERADWATIPIIILTQDRSPGDRMRGLELGVDDYLTKPVYMQELVTRARIVLTRARRARIESEVPTKTRFTGRLADMGIADLVQTVEVSRKSGVIHLERDDGRRGDIYLREGRVIDAESGRHAGERALFRLLLWHDGNFTVEFKTVHRKDAIDRGNQAVLLEGMRRLDEWHRVCEGLPSLHSVIEVIYDRLAERLGDVPDSVNSLLRLLDGRRTIEQAIEDCDLDDLDALRALKLLCDKSMVRVTATRSATADRGLTPPPTPVAPRVAALTTRRKTFDAPRVSLEPASGAGEAGAAAFSSPAARPMGATTVIGHSIVTTAPPTAQADARPITPPIEPAVGSGVAPPAAPRPPRMTLERGAARLQSPPPVSVPTGAPPAQVTTPNPAPAPQARQTTPEPRRRIPTEPPRAGMGAPGRVRRITPVQAPVIPFPTPAVATEASAAPSPPAASIPADTTTVRESSFVRSLAHVLPRSEGGEGERGGAEADFFSVAARTAEHDAPLSDADISVVRSVVPSPGKKIFFAIALGAVVMAALAVALIPKPRPTEGPAVVIPPAPPEPSPAPPAPVVPEPPALAPAPMPAATPASEIPPATPAPATVVPPLPPDPSAPPASTGPAPPPPGDYAALLADADKAYRRGRGRDADKLAEQALLIDPEGHAALALRAAVALDAGRARVAGEWADKALKKNADSARAHAVKGAVLADKGDVAGAKTHFSRYLEIEPGGDLADDIRQALKEM